MNLSRNPARWISIGAAALGVLVVEGVLTPVEMEAYMRLIVAVVMLAVGGGAGEIVRSKVSPIDEEQSTYVVRRDP